MTRRKVSLLAAKLLILASCLFLVQASAAQPTEELHLVSPIGGVVRSIILPGWGQFYAHSPFQGTLSFVGTSGLLIGALIAHQSFRDVYNNAYLPLAVNDPDSPDTIFEYNRANQRFKLRQFFLFTAVGVWMYSIIDSYVGANLYNATTKANQLIDEAEQIEKLGVQFGITPTRFHLGIVKSF